MLVGLLVVSGCISTFHIYRMAAKHSTSSWHFAGHKYVPLTTENGAPLDVCWTHVKVGLIASILSYLQWILTLTSLPTWHMVSHLSPASCVNLPSFSTLGIWPWLSLPGVRHSVSAPGLPFDGNSSTIVKQVSINDIVGRPWRHSSGCRNSSVILNFGNIGLIY